MYKVFLSIMKDKVVRCALPAWALFAATGFAADQNKESQAEPPLPVQGPDVMPSPPATLPETGAPQTGASPAATPLPGMEDRMKTTSDSFWLTDYPLNELFQYLASEAGYQYFYSPSFKDITVTGQLYRAGAPMEQMQELALQYNLVLYHRGRTVYAMTQEQLANLPQQELRYSLKYLHPTQDEVQRMLGRFLTPDRGSATLEPKINTIVVVDNETVLRRVSAHLARLDRPKRQISIQVRVVSVNISAGKGVGVDWSNTLGAAGLTINSTAQITLNSLFGFDPWSSWANIIRRGDNTAPTSLGNPSGTAITVGPVTVSAILRALYENSRVTLTNAPLVVTEDNEPATVNVVTRTPIVTSTATVSQGVTTISNQVRYEIDEKDPTEPPSARREIGTQLTVLPTILPDGTIRLSVTGGVSSQTGSLTVSAGSGITNTYPIVNESHLNNLARIPSGYSLIIGGFINESETETKNKVPVLGDIPFVGYAFRSKNLQKNRTNLAFIITPVEYDAASAAQSVTVSEKNRQDYSLTPNDNYADRQELGQNAELSPAKLQKALAPNQTEQPDTNPISDRSNQNIYAVPLRTRQEVKQKRIEERYRYPIEVRRALPVDPPRVDPLPVSP
ncbi:MAG: type II secretion system protein GspD [Verrucomicrobia bacterium]|nr:type II secretion system protein GspD [Verrucomicrobiota bacterium]